MTASKQIEVFAGNIIEAGMVCSLLESSDIHAFLKDEIMGTMNPWFVSAGGVGAVKVLVSSIDFEKARFVVDTYRDSSN
jgi:hypothetical protein